MRDNSMEHYLFQTLYMMVVIAGVWYAIPTLIALVHVLG